MKRSTRYKRIISKKHKRYLLTIVLVLIVIAYPLRLISKNVSASVVLDQTVHANRNRVVDYNYDMEIYENFENDHAKFSSMIIERIEQAEEAIYVAMYSFNIEAIKDALLDAAQRGVKVNLVLNSDQKDDLEELFGSGRSYFKINYLGSSEDEDNFYHMHHKFMIVDPGTENEVLLTGPWNWSYFQEDKDPNILIKLKDAEIIDSYLNEFLRLQNGDGGILKFGDWDYLPWEKEITYLNGDIIELWWSPGREKNSLNQKIIELIEEADTSIDIAITLFDSKNIAKKIIQKATQGVKVRIIVDVNFMEQADNIIPWLTSKHINNIEIYKGGTLPTYDNPIYSVLHYQNMIIDDEVVLTGTANWTHGGFFRNDENTLIIYSNEVAGKFKTIFEKYLRKLS